MRKIARNLALFFGTTFEDWMLAAMVVAILSLVVFGVRSCANDYVRDTRSQEVQNR